MQVPSLVRELGPYMPWGLTSPSKKIKSLLPPKKTHRKKIGGAETKLKRQEGTKLEYRLQSHGEELGVYSKCCQKLMSNRSKTNEFPR